MIHQNGKGIQRELNEPRNTREFHNAWMRMVTCKSYEEENYEETCGRMK